MNRLSLRVMGVRVSQTIVAKRCLPTRGTLTHDDLKTVFSGVIPRQSQRILEIPITVARRTNTHHYQVDTLDPDDPQSGHNQSIFLPPRWPEKALRLYPIFSQVIT